MDKYIGFYIDRPIGNNIFSYEERENKKIYVPKLNRRYIEMMF